MAEEINYRFTHYHGGRVMMAPEFTCTDDEDARAWFRSHKGLAPGQRIEPHHLCWCGGEKLERQITRKRTSSEIEFGPPWVEVSLVN